METVKYSRLDRWGWSCPECEYWNEEEDDPAYQKTLTCAGCGKQFEGEEE